LGRVHLVVRAEGRDTRGDGAAGTLRRWLHLGECLEVTTSGEQNSRRVGYDRGGRPIGWLSTGIVQGSVLKILIYCKGDWAPDSRRILSYITVCGYDTTYLQENSQRLG